MARRLTGARLDLADDVLVAFDLAHSAGWTDTNRLVHTDQDGVVYDEHVFVKRLD